MVHPQAGDVLEVAQHLFALAPAVEHHRHRADVHAVRRLEQQVRRHAVELDEHHADPRRARRHVDVEQPLDRHAVDELVRQRRRVVHARHVGAALHVRELFAGLLHAGVEVTDHRLDAQHLFGVELHHQPQHAVRRRVLRTHVDDHRVVERVRRPHAAAGDARPPACAAAAGAPARLRDVWRSRRSSSISSSLRISVIAGAGRL